MYELSPETMEMAEAFRTKGLKTYIGTDYDCRYLSVQVAADEASGRTVSARFSYVQGAVRIASMTAGGMLPPGRYVYVTIGCFHPWHELLAEDSGVLNAANRMAYEVMQREAFINFHGSFSSEDVISLQLVVPMQRGESIRDAALDTFAQLERVVQAVMTRLVQMGEAADSRLDEV